MKNNRFKILIILIIGIIIASSISVYATYNYFAGDVKYTKNNGTEISVEESLNELYKELNNRAIRKYGNVNTKFDAQTTIYTDVYENNSNNILNMVYYFKINYTGAEHVYNYLQVSVDNGITWQNLYGYYGRTTVQGKYELQPGSKVRLATQKRASIEFYEIYFSNT